jgi:hypothetical protein
MFIYIKINMVQRQLEMRQQLLKNFLDNEYGEELYEDMKNLNLHTTLHNVLYYLKINNCLTNDEDESIQPEYLPIVDAITDIFETDV